MRRKPTISTSRMVSIYTEMVSLRRMIFKDDQFFTIPEAWESIAGDDSNWQLRTHRDKKSSDYKLRAGVVVLDDNVIITVDERLLDDAKRGNMQANFVLAHELGHLGLRDHDNSALTKNFQLFNGPNGNSNLPPNVEELEANYAAVIFQCGVALENPRFEALELARRAHSDPYTVKKVRQLVRLDVFQRELYRPRPKPERVIL